METLERRWQAAARGVGAPDPAAVAGAGTELLTRWREPHRRYHTVDHLTAVLDVIDRHAGHADRPDLVRLAAWCHDAVYDPRAPGDTNERDSAALAGDLLTAVGVPTDAVAEVRRLVLLTAGHAVAADDRDGALLCDADLAVLAATPQRYDGYAARIRQEYAHVPEAAFRSGRAAVLEKLLDLPALFHVPALAARWEAPARANLTRELTTLRHPD
ncbi:metal-dependent phosphohydrolase [Micromonospora sp. WMMD882]|uniref:HD domain-containing protein n=1 Tax=Micromonospora sp. WMMD882 TaxID=3015151 RepID=UPI00248BCE68|nr:metal-dependent phosphohydrolase [Micromonospora sp. WMMD882]WBB78959.1 metal-dependent phosphohydrolase [Micromonospora sp. WMMD882]